MMIMMMIMRIKAKTIRKRSATEEEARSSHHRFLSERITYSVVRIDSLFLCSSSCSVPE